MFLYIGQKGQPGVSTLFILFELITFLPNAPEKQILPFTTIKSPIWTTETQPLSV